MIKIKDRVIIKVWTDEMWVAATCVQQVWMEMNLPDCPWITSAMEGVHGSNSFHYLNQALDFRTKNIPSLETRHKFCREVKKRLRAVSYRFDVIFEYAGLNNEHLHIEWDTRKP